MSRTAGVQCPCISIIRVNGVCGVYVGTQLFGKILHVVSS